MTKTFAFLALASVAVPAMAEPTRFTRDGQTFVYTTEQKGDETVLSGRRMGDGSEFVFTVRGNRVTGMMDNVPVSFTIARPLAPSVELSRR